MNAGTAAEELLPASLVGLKKCSSVDISLQSPRYVSPKAWYDSAKRLPLVEVAKGACYAMQCLCITMYKGIHKWVMFANYIFANIMSFAKFAKISKYTVGIHCTWLRRRSHYGGKDGDSDGDVTFSRSHYK